jgi:type II secretory pathway pseudopilin PulG
LDIDLRTRRGAFMRRHRIATGCTIATLLTTAVFALPAPTAELEENLPVVAHLPKDLVMVWAGDVGMFSEIYDGVLKVVRRFLSEEELEKMNRKLAELDEKLGLELRGDLFAHLGPQVAFTFDVPPIDATMGAVMAGAENSIGRALSGNLVVIQIDDEEALRKTMTRLLELSEAQIEVSGPVVKMSWPQFGTGETGPGNPQPPSLYYAIANGLYVSGFDGELVESILEPLPDDRRMTSGEDFQKVFEHLDRDVDSVTYVNLPKIQQRLRESGFLEGMAVQDDELKPVLDFILDPGLAQTGIGATTRKLDGGVRQTVFGPSWTGGGASMVGIVAAIAIPNMINAIDKGRQQRTMADMRVLGVALETFAVENGTYPVSDGWIECSDWEPLFVPEYLEKIQAVDGWENPLRCFGDGDSYRIVSGGKDGELDMDYAGEIEGGETFTFNEDIVFVDGEFVVYPSGTQPY